jgi:hypothetical protein
VVYKADPRSVVNKSDKKSLSFSTFLAKFTENLAVRKENSTKMDLKYFWSISDLNKSVYQFNLKIVLFKQRKLCDINN